ncbi:MAG: PAS domain S-box protein, partial [Desulfomonile tiedjei]|nr:PAS domain S-box protein [Desulfomonile tiedjei]
MSLRTKLFLPLGLSVVLLASYVYGFWIPRLLGDADNDFQRSTERHLESVAEGLVPLILGNDLDAIYANLDALLRKNGDWWNIRLFDREGRSLYPIDDSLNAKSDKTEDLRTLVHEISYLGVKLGSVELQADFAQRLNDIRKRCLTLVYTFLAAMLLFFLFTGLLLDRVVRRPIKALADASERLVAGEFEMPLPKPDNGEVGTLLKSFANMREAIRTNSQRLLEGNKQLRREIAERSKVEKALRESERRFRIMADSSPMMLWVSGTDALCTFFNKRWLEFRGRTLEQEEGNGWAEGVHPEDFDRCLETYMSAFERREEFSMEYRLQRFDGEFRWIWDIGVPRFSSDGEFSGYIGSCIDVTERKLAEEAKVRSERIYRQMFEGSRAVKMLIDPETSELIDANPAAEHFYGYAAEDLKRMKISDINILPPEQIFSEMARAKALNKLHFFFKHRLASGEIRDVEVHSSPLDFGDKLILYSIIHDVTERKKAEESADRANRDWERTFNAISDMVMVLDDQYKIIRANKATADAYGMSEQELVGRLCFEIAHGENDPPAFCPHSLLLKDGKEHSIEAWEPRLGCTLDTRVSPVLDDSGAIIGAVHVARDVSERKRAERSISLMNFALDNVREAAFLVDENARFLYVNEEACRVLGYSRAELLTLGVPDIDPDLPLERWAAHWNDLKTYPSLTFETRHKARDGHTLPVEISANYFEYDGQGYNLGLVRDITERKQAEQDRLNHLRFFESMDRVNRAIQTTDDLEQMMRDALEAVFSIFDCDRAWLFYPCDPDAPSFRVPMEITKPEYPGAKIFNVDIPMPEDMAQNLREALESVGPVTYTAGTEKPINKVSADQFGVKSMMMVALYPKSGKPWAFGLHQCSYTRVWTQEDERLFQEIGRRLADALTSFLAYSSLQESEEKLSAAARIAHVGYWERDYSAESITLSEEACKIFGLPQNFRFPKLPEWHERWKILIHPDDRQKTTQAFADAMRGGPVYDIEYRVVWPNGDVRAVHSHGEVTRDESGRPRRVLGTMQDVTERKQQENEALSKELLALKDKTALQMAAAEELKQLKQASGKLAGEKA